MGSSGGRLSSLQPQSGHWPEPPRRSESRRYFIKRPARRWDGLIYSHQVQRLAPPPPAVCAQRGRGRELASLRPGSEPLNHIDRQTEIEKCFKLIVIIKLWLSQYYIFTSDTISAILIPIPCFFFAVLISDFR